MKKYDVYLHYSGYCHHQVEAEDEGDAIEKARELPIKENDVLNNLEPWEESDTAEEVDYEEKSEEDAD